MEQQIVNDRLRHCVMVCAGTRPITLTQSTRLVEDLGYDSLRLIELVVLLEHELGISLPAGRTPAGIITLADLQRFVTETVHECRQP